MSLYISSDHKRYNNNNNILKLVDIAHVAYRLRAVYSSVIDFERVFFLLLFYSCIFFSVFLVFLRLSTSLCCKRVFFHSLCPRQNNTLYIVVFMIFCCCVFVLFSFFVLLEMENETGNTRSTIQKNVIGRVSLSENCIRGNGRWSKSNNHKLDIPMFISISKRILCVH